MFRTEANRVHFEKGFGGCVEKKSEFGLTDASSKEIKELSEMLAKVDRIYEAEGEDMTQFPMFKFEEPKVVIPASSLHVEYPKEPENNVEV
ncbi:unnamed protein product [Schistosoma curassoni]|uniref:ATP synthase-coupling factor 6, mitochondrial n=1 Tax=Schistosoma curassoni TaxID=6186 RepID=A0A183JME1_9TREM|nr:unnamed protein product [Schistosoma curassoni]